MGGTTVIWLYLRHMIELVGQNVKQMEIKDSKGSFEGRLNDEVSQ